MSFLNREPAVTTLPAASAVPRPEMATLGAVHLEVTDLEGSTAFWRDIVGLIVRSTAPDAVELGTETDTLVTIHPGARSGFQQGHSGLYHLAIHPPTEPDFARILLRLARAGWPISPTDHVMSKSIYLLDPDGITIEITLETPQRLREMVANDRGMYAVHVDGTVSSGRDPLDVRVVLATLTDDDSTVPVPVGTKIGHVHLYLGDLEAGFEFYQSLGFTPALWAPAIGMADLGAGGAFNHRIAMNTWQGVGATPAPEGTARMRHYTVRLDTAERLDRVLGILHQATETEDGYLTRDPSGNALLLARP
ncbi:VOC family protein [soil metagenome]